MGPTVTGEDSGTGGGREPISKNTRNLIGTFTYHRITHVIDIGANVGQYAQRLRRGGFDGHIVSIEPNPAVHPALADAAADDPNWTLWPPVALGDAKGTLTLNRPAASDMASALPLTDVMAGYLDDANPVDQVDVPVKRLDALFDQLVPADARVAVKSDTQGYEAAVLSGADRVLSRITVLQIELSLIPVYSGAVEWRAMIDRLSGLGFEPILFIPGYFHKRTGRLIEMDGVFARRDTL